MAVFPSIPGLAIYIIKDNGEPLQEYDDPDNITEDDQAPAILGGRALGDHKTDQVFKYIESATGQKFSMRCELDSQVDYGADAVITYMYIDGNYIGSNSFEFEDGRPKRTHFIRTGIREGENMRRPFQFSELKIVEEDAHPGLVIGRGQDAAANVGEITIKIWRESLIQRPPKSRSRHSQPSQPPKRTAHAPLSEISEKALKGSAKTHAISYGEVVPIHRGRSRNRASVPDVEKPRRKRIDKTPIAKLMVIPRTPEPSPEPIESPVLAPARALSFELQPEQELNLDDLDEENRCRVRQFMRNLVGPSNSSRVKIEDQQAGTRVKREHRDPNFSDSQGTSSRNKGKMAEQNVLIDLTTNSGSRKRAKISAQAAVIDLTDD